MDKYAIIGIILFTIFVILFWSTNRAMLIGLIVDFFMVGLVTFFVTRNTGKNLKRDWPLFFIPLGFWIPTALLNFETSDIPYYIGTSVTETLMFGSIGYFVFRKTKGA